MPRTHKKRIVVKTRPLVNFAAITFAGLCIINIHLAAYLDSTISAKDNNLVSPYSSSRNRKGKVKTGGGGKDRASRQCSCSPTFCGCVNITADAANDAINSSIQNKNATDNKSIAKIFHQAGVELDEESIQRLPSWAQIESVIGPKPVMLGLERCNDYRNNVPPLRRMLGSAGMFNSGTNLVSSNVV